MNGKLLHYHVRNKISNPIQCVNKTNLLFYFWGLSNFVKTFYDIQRYFLSDLFSQGFEQFKERGGLGLRKVKYSILPTTSHAYLSIQNKMLMFNNIRGGVSKGEGNEKYSLVLSIILSIAHDFFTVYTVTTLNNRLTVGEKNTATTTLHRPQ